MGRPATPEDSSQRRRAIVERAPSWPDAILIKSRRVAEPLGLSARAFDLGHPARVDAAIKDVTVVLCAAGPFSATSRPVADACLRNRAHYLDITGEIDVFEALAARDAEAKARGIMLPPELASTSCRATASQRI